MAPLVRGAGSPKVSLRGSRSLPPSFAFGKTHLPRQREARERFALRSSPKYCPFPAPLRDRRILLAVVGHDPFTNRRKKALCCPETGNTEEKIKNFFSISLPLWGRWLPEGQTERAAMESTPCHDGRPHGVAPTIPMVALGLIVGVDAHIDPPSTDTLPYVDGGVWAPRPTTPQATLPRTCRGWRLSTAR